MTSPKELAIILAEIAADLALQGHLWRANRIQEAVERLTTPDCKTTAPEEQGKGVSPPVEGPGHSGFAPSPDGLGHSESVPDAALVSTNSVAGHLAMWAVRQSPYPAPDNMPEAIAGFKDEFPHDPEASIGDFHLSRWASKKELGAAIMKTFERVSAIMWWNVPKSGHDAPMVFSSRYDKPSPDDDIIDLYALASNVARSAWAEAWAETCSDAGIDLTDIPETTDFGGAVRGKYYRPAQWDGSGEAGETAQQAPSRSDDSPVPSEGRDAPNPSEDNPHAPR